MSTIDWKNHKFDSSDSIFFEKQLEYLSAKVIDEAATQIPLDYATWLPVSTEFPVGAMNFTWTELTAAGRAKWISDSAKNIPTVSVGGTQHSITQHTIALGFDYTKMEILRARYAGVPLESRKVKAVVRGLQEGIDGAAWLGASEVGMNGFCMYPGTTEVSLTDGATGSKTLWNTKTAAEIVKDVTDVYNGIVVTTNYMEEPDICMIPPAQYQLIAAKQFSTASDTTVLQWLQKTFPTITFVKNRRLVGVDTVSAPGDSGDLIVMYKRDSDHLEFHLPLAYEQEAPQQDGLSYFVPSYAVVGGLTVYKPLSIAWASGI